MKEFRSFLWGVIKHEPIMLLMTTCYLGAYIYVGSPANQWLGYLGFIVAYLLYMMNGATFSTLQAYKGFLVAVTASTTDNLEHLADLLSLSRKTLEVGAKETSAAATKEAERFVNLWHNDMKEINNSEQRNDTEPC